MRFTGLPIASAWVLGQAESLQSQEGPFPIFFEKMGRLLNRPIYKRFTVLCF